ncbi:AT hook motif-containing protein [Raphanus sativus]|uniref:Uncharacterized protein LOC108839741 n=1 Tax=Raphanus sativus TaxID=3726 RepID=A0A6J0M6M1_RAPSA|nr:uncharacterized protein LOC108839741 [Raphanus sativus]XP_018468017.2 uncharacterized protein LOC108839741 [Raphanus sativus]XP_056858684.1 uncharacterized protein LOC108839741 [Raphanus sativus]KAJ4911447.1 AT hook motif-containing protein [Raphanus sativus]
MMGHQTNYQGSSSSSLANTRKRGRRPEGQEAQHPPTDENLIGQAFSGVVEGSFEAGYFLNVKVVDTEKQLKGIVFLPDKVAPLTPATDLFPQAKMYVREHNITTPQQLEVKKNQADDQSAMLPDHHPMSLGSEAADERNHPVDTEMKDVGLTEPEDQTLSLMPQFGSDDVHKEDHTVLTFEACVASKEAVTATTSSLEDSFAKGSTTFVDFFPAASATNLKQATGSSSSFSLELFQSETKQPGTEAGEKKSPADAEPRGVEVKSASPVDDDDVPEELQLELGNKKMNASAVVTVANPDQPGSSSKSGFLVNLFECREETVKEPEQSNAAASESVFSEAAGTRVDDDNDS